MIITAQRNSPNLTKKMLSIKQMYNFTLARNDGIHHGTQIKPMGVGNLVIDAVKLDQSLYSMQCVKNCISVIVCNNST